MKKTLSLAMALTLAVSGAAFAEATDTDLQAQLDAANAKIEELQALVDKYEPYYTMKLAATYGEDGIIWVDDVLAEYDSLASMYAQYGIDLEAYGMAGSMKQDILQTAAEEAILKAKAVELGLDTLTEEQTADVEAAADETMSTYINSYKDYFYPDEELTDEMKAEAEAYFTANGIDRASIVAEQTESYILENVKAYAVKDVALTEEDVKAAYDSLSASNQETYTSDPSAFVSDYGTATIAWYPEGYRAVKQVLIAFDDDQKSRMSDLNSQLTTLNAELEAVQNPAEETPAEGEEAAAEATEEAAAEETAAPRTVEEINADIADVNAQIDALYEELMPEVNEVTEAFKNGTSIEELIEKYNDDPGMTNEPTKTTGYAVAADSTNWDPSFRDAAMSIANIGEMAEPARGSYGIYMVYYMDDITPGEVDMETIRESLEETALNEKTSSVYADTLAAWCEEAGLTYYYENLGITQ